jgi:GTP-binding protein HflX
VVDTSSPSAPEQTIHVMKVLAEIGAAGIPQLLVLNKIDKLDDNTGDAQTLGRRVLAGAPAEGQPTRAVAISAQTGFGLENLLAAIDEVLPFDPVTRARFRFPSSEGARVSLLHDAARVLDISYTGEFTEMTAEVPESLKNRLREFLVSDR